MVALLLLMPLSATVVVGAALFLRRLPAGMAVAWLITGALCVGMALAIASIGILVLPVCLAVVVVCLADGGSARAVLPSVERIEPGSH